MGGAYRGAGAAGWKGKNAANLLLFVTARRLGAPAGGGDADGFSTRHIGHIAQEKDV